MSNPVALPEIFKQGMNDFIIPTSVVAPFTTIQNRAQVSNSLKAIAGVERIMFKNPVLLPKEFGPNGENTYEMESKDSRIRMVGTWSALNNDQGTRVQSVIVGNYMEITAYCTGLNMLIYMGSGAGDLRCSVDGGPDGANLYTASSTVLDARNYGKNTVVSVVSGLTLDWHTFKITIYPGAGGNGLSMFGIEILNERSNIAVSPGKAIAEGSQNILSVLSTSAFNKKVSGTRGARVVKYIENNKLKTAVQEVDIVPKYLTLADHTNEEVLRRIHPREFGANRGDDFSTLTGSSDRAFTLDDGTTTLTGLSCFFETLGFSGALEGMGVNSGSNYWVLTFVGTGLDLVVSSDSASRTMSLIVDGVAQGTVVPPVNAVRTIKLCSGLSYGTHTIKLLNLNAFGTFGTLGFIIYQPKKPTIPDNTFEVADYNVMANFIPNNTSDRMSNGVLRKLNIREFTYVGTYSLGLNTNFPSGFGEGSTQANGNYIEYTFFGTGYDHRFLEQNARCSNVAVTLNGLALTTANFPTALTTTTGNGVAMNLSTGILDMQATGGGLISSVTVYNLPLATYKVRFTKNDATATVLEVSALDIITPIHINEPSFKIGSQSLHSNQNYDMIKSISELKGDLSEAKAWFVYDSTTTKIVSSYNVSAIVRTAAGSGHVYFEKPFKNDTYLATGSANNGASTIVTFITKRANSILFQTTTNAGSLTENLVACVFFGDIISE